MKMATFLQLFLLFDVFLMGAIAATALRHAYAHFRHEEHEPVKAHIVAPQNAHLPPAVREHLLEVAQTNFQSVLDHSAVALQKDLENIATEIKKQVEKLGTQATNKELEHYLTTIAQLQKQTESNMGARDKELNDRQAELQAQLVADIAAEKQRLMQQMDTKLADTMASFLLETLQHNIDLGAQTTYLTSMLEEHKADLIKEVTNEA